MKIYVVRYRWEEMVETVYEVYHFKLRKVVQGCQSGSFILDRAGRPEQVLDGRTDAGWA